MNHSSAMIDGKPHLDYIDGLKGLAILMVLFFHVSLHITGEFYFPHFHEKVEHLSRGVHLFFIVSGFALFHSSANWEKLKFPVVSFYLKRFFRIFPLWWLVVTLYYLNDPAQPVSKYLATMFLYFGFSLDGWNLTIIPVAWSLFVEESFYLFFPLWRKFITKWTVALLFIVISYFVAIYWYKYAPYFFQGPNFTAVHPLGNYYAFFVGIFLFYFNQRFKLDKLDRISLAWLIDICCLVGIIYIFMYDRMVGTLALVPIFVASFFRNTFFGKVLRFKILKNFGICCYSVYILHPLIMMKLIPYKDPFFTFLKMENTYGEWRVLIWFIVVCIFTLTIGTISCIIFERPSIKLGKLVIKKLNSRKLKELSPSIT